MHFRESKWLVNLGGYIPEKGFVDCKASRHLAVKRRTHNETNSNELANFRGGVDVIGRSKMRIEREREEGK